MEDNEWNNTATNLNHSKKLVLESGLDSQCRIQMMPPLPPTIFSDDTSASYLNVYCGVGKYPLVIHTGSLVRSESLL